MALRPCRECGKEISSQAPVCPNCGVREPHINPRGKLYFWLGIGGFFLVMYLVSQIGGMLPSSSQSASPASPPNYESDAYYACKAAVTNTLKAPSTAKFPWRSEARVRRYGDTIAFKSYVDSENSFGAMLRKNWLCAATVTGGNVQVVAAGLDE